MTIGSSSAYHSTKEDELPNESAAASSSRLPPAVTTTSAAPPFFALPRSDPTRSQEPRKRQRLQNGSKPSSAQSHHIGSWEQTDRFGGSSFENRGNYSPGGSSSTSRGGGSAEQWKGPSYINPLSGSTDRPQQPRRGVPSSTTAALSSFSDLLLPATNTTIYASKLQVGISQHEVRTAFSDYGIIDRVSQVKTSKKKSNQQVEDFCFITFADSMGCEKALRSKTYLRGSLVSVQLSRILHPQPRNTAASMLKQPNSLNETSSGSERVPYQAKSAVKMEGGSWSNDVAVTTGPRTLRQPSEMNLFSSVSQSPAPPPSSSSFASTSNAISIFPRPTVAHCRQSTPPHQSHQQQSLAASLHYPPSPTPASISAAMSAHSSSSAPASSSLLATNGATSNLSTNNRVTEETRITGTRFEVAQDVVAEMEDIKPALRHVPKPLSSLVRRNVPTSVTDEGEVLLRDPVLFPLAISPSFADSVKMKAHVEFFLNAYFDRFDGSRSTLGEFYTATAHFSARLILAEPDRSKSEPPSFTSKYVSSVNKLHTSPPSIVGAIKKLFGCSHNLSSITYDALAIGTSILLVVHGDFQQYPSARPPIFRSFDRTFLLVGKSAVSNGDRSSTSPSAYLIQSDLLTYRHHMPPPDALKVLLPPSLARSRSQLPTSPRLLLPLAIPRRKAAVIAPALIEQRRLELDHQSSTSTLTTQDQSIVDTAALRKRSSRDDSSSDNDSDDSVVIVSGNPPSPEGVEVIIPPSKKALGKRAAVERRGISPRLPLFHIASTSSAGSRLEPLPSTSADVSMTAWQLEIQAEVAKIAELTSSLSKRIAAGAPPPPQLAPTSHPADSFPSTMMHLPTSKAVPAHSDMLRTSNAVASGSGITHQDRSTFLHPGRTTSIVHGAGSKAGKMRLMFDMGTTYCSVSSVGGVSEWSKHSGNVRALHSSGDKDRVDSMDLATDGTIVIGYLCPMPVLNQPVVVRKHEVALFCRNDGRNGSYIPLTERPHLGKGGVTAVSAIESPRVKFATAGDDKSIVIWRAKSSDSKIGPDSFRTTKLTSEHTSTILSLAGYSSRRWLLSVSAKTMYTHDLTTKQNLQKFTLDGVINNVQEISPMPHCALLTTSAQTNQFHIIDFRAPETAMLLFGFDSPLVFSGKRAGELSNLTRFIRGEFRDDYLFAHGNGGSDVLVYDVRGKPSPFQRYALGRSKIIHTLWEGSSGIALLEAYNYTSIALS